MSHSIFGGKLLYYFVFWKEAYKKQLQSQIYKCLQKGICKNILYAFNNSTIVTSHCFHFFIFLQTDFDKLEMDPEIEIRFPTPGVDVSTIKCHNSLDFYR